VARGRGGMRPTAPQNNPMNVSATGGNGQNATATQAAQYIPGLPYGEGQQMMDTQQSAPLAAAPGIESSGMAMSPGAAAAKPVIGLNEKSYRSDEPVTSGASFGAGVGPEGLGPTPEEKFMNQMMEDNIKLLEYLPSLEAMANDPSVSNTFRGFVQYLKTIA
jgi:hypothetical protein